MNVGQPPSAVTRPNSRGRLFHTINIAQVIFSPCLGGEFPFSHQGARTIPRAGPAAIHPRGEISTNRTKNFASSAESVGQGTASGRAILSVCGSASSTFWAPCEWPGKRASMFIPTSCTSCPPCGVEFLVHFGLFFVWFERAFHKEERRRRRGNYDRTGAIRKSVTSGCCRPGSLPRQQNL